MKWSLFCNQIFWSVLCWAILLRSAELKCMETPTESEIITIDFPFLLSTLLLNNKWYRLDIACRVNKHHAIAAKSWFVMKTIYCHWSDWKWLLLMMLAARRRYLRHFESSIDILCENWSAQWCRRRALYSKLPWTINLNQFSFIDDRLGNFKKFPKSIESRRMCRKFKWVSFFTFGKLRKLSGMKIRLQNVQRETKNISCNERRTWEYSAYTSMLIKIRVNVEQMLLHKVIEM